VVWSGPGMTYSILYFGPSLPFGGSAVIGSGCWPNTAGKKPVDSAIVPSFEPLDGSPPESLFRTIDVPRPGPLIVACDAPFASAAEATQRAAPPTAARIQRRFITRSFRKLRCRLYTGGAGLVPRLRRPRQPLSAR